MNRVKARDPRKEWRNARSPARISWIAQTWGIPRRRAARAPPNVAAELEKMIPAFRSRAIRPIRATARRLRSRAAGWRQTFAFSVTHHFIGTTSTETPAFSAAGPSGPGRGMIKAGTNILRSKRRRVSKSQSSAPLSSAE